MRPSLYWAAHLNKKSGEVVRLLALKAANVTGFGLGGHLVEMARASDVSVVVNAASIPLMKGAYELASMGLVPIGSHDNRAYFSCFTQVADDVDTILADIIFDAQTSGGLFLLLRINSKKPLPC